MLQRYVRGAVVHPTVSYGGMLGILATAVACCLCWPVFFVSLVAGVYERLLVMRLLVAGLASGGLVVGTIGGGYVLGSGETVLRSASAG